MMSLDEAEAEFTRLCKEISALENRLCAVRKRAEKLAFYIEIAREKESATGEPAEMPLGRSTVVPLRRRRRHNRQ